MTISPNEPLPSKVQRIAPRWPSDKGQPPIQRVLLTPDEVAELLRTSRKAVYAMVERQHLPGVTRLGRRVLFRSDVLLQWLYEK